MEIAVKSETDSRILLYPLIKTLYPYGTIAVYSSNRYLTRLVENELEGGFKNIRVVIDPEGDLEAIKESDDYVKNKYDFVIYDNVGAVNYDILLCILTNRLSESYVQDLIYVIQDDKTHILKFGKAAPTPKSEKSKVKQKSKGKAGEAEEVSQEEENENWAFNKWTVERTDEDVLQEILTQRKSKWCKFPSFDMIEDMESKHILPTPDDGLIKEFYRLFGESLSVDERMFTKGARVKDESSSDISGTDVR